MVHWTHPMMARHLPGHVQASGCKGTKRWLWYLKWEIYGKMMGNSLPLVHHHSFPSKNLPVLRETMEQTLDSTEFSHPDVKNPSSLCLSSQFLPAFHHQLTCSRTKTSFSMRKPLRYFPRQPCHVSFGRLWKHCQCVSGFRACDLSIFVLVSMTEPLISRCRDQVASAFSQ